MYDVIVVGGGPGGSVAAKRCAQSGLKTLLLERKKLPRDKVCSGMVMGPWANDIIQQEFGTIPLEVLVDPYQLSGHMMHVPGAQLQRILCKTPLAWRKDLDFWMIQMAREDGVEIWEGAKVIEVSQKAGACTVTMMPGKTPQELKSRFVIGADGGASAVRKSLFPLLKVQYAVPMRECYNGALDLEKDYFHWFFPKCRSRPRFGLNHKGDCFLIEGSGIKELRNEINQILVKYGFNTKNKAIWKDGCLIPRLHEALLSGSFSPAKGNILLIGDAAGLLFPITFEGIGTALKSGILAADSVARSVKEGSKVAGIYLQEIKSILKTIRSLHSWNKILEQEATKGVADLSKALKAAYGETLKVS
ncbi:MAG: FAD-dependent monooxygenase [Desulfobacteraceae bacterium]|jgi:flavin-dependent dehydrogenase|nr:FAD-dependent monooxygenase [Desulfobacterales bacterium]MDH3876624.1 FAD-dependent monooxygenase [Desulfobacterales bacterium]MDH3957410.1 FAD-dependent monooxygenase [Desulfobacteraceae bacterium]